MTGEIAGVAEEIAKAVGKPRFRLPCCLFPASAGFHFVETLFSDGLVSADNPPFPRFTGAAMPSLRYRPARFFILCVLIPWPLWFAAAYISHQNPSPAMLQAEAALGIAGLVAPALIAARMVLPNPQLRADMAARLLRINGFPKRYLFAALLLLPVLLVLAQLLSLLFGHSLSQFHISGRPSFSSAVLSPWFVLTFAAAVEELAWHGYGTDALLSRLNLFAASLLFTVYWALWHLPLGFIQGYYHSEVLTEGPLYTANFVFSMVAFVLLGNWLYLKSGRSILLAVLFHLTANVGNEIFATHPDSKLIQTSLFALLVGYILVKERRLFFSEESYE